ISVGPMRMRRFARRLGLESRRALMLPVLACLSIVCLSGTVRAADKCGPLQRLIEAPMLQDEDFSPVITVQLNDKPAKLLLDTGGFWSIVSPAMAAGLPVRTTRVRGALDLQGLPLDKLVKMPSMQIGPARVADVDF